ncbi:MAG: hypothetical protein ACREA4_12245, partial [Nitrososphaera sp.]
MVNYMRILTVFLVSVAAVVSGTASPGAWAAPFSASKFIFEVNATDCDAGIQVFLDARPWKNVKIFNPDGDQIAEFQAQGGEELLEGFGLTELFSESNEPPCEDFPFQDVLDLFPEGKYEFKGTTVDGAMLKSTDTLTHDIPCGPVIVSPAEGATVDQPVVIEWEEVTKEFDPNPDPDFDPDFDCKESTDLNIVAYQVIVEQENPQTPPLVFSVFVPAETTSVTVPPEFIQADTQWKFEV